MQVGIHLDKANEFFCSILEKPWHNVRSFPGSNTQLGKNHERKTDENEDKG